MSDLIRIQLFDTDDIPERFFSKMLILEKNQQSTKIHEKLPSMSRIVVYYKFL